jgi:hypothetical protein
MSNTTTVWMLTSFDPNSMVSMWKNVPFLWVLACNLLSNDSGKIESKWVKINSERVLLLIPIFQCFCTFGVF